MREIKFRAWNKFERIMFSPMPIVDFKTMEINAIELMQYTGLKDKNGKECYHKDIVRRMGILYTMEWHDNLAGWFLKPLCGGWHGTTKSDMALMCEVIGNIYENPELLGE